MRRVRAPPNDLARRAPARRSSPTELEVVEAAVPRSCDSSETTREHAAPSRCARAPSAAFAATATTGIFFTGQIVSLAGTWMQNVALAWLVIELSDSPLAIGASPSGASCRSRSSGSSPASSPTASTTRQARHGDAGVRDGRSRSRSRSSTLTDTATLPIVYVLAALGGVALAFDAPGRQSLTFQMVGPRGASERRRAQLGPLQRLARDRPGDRRSRHRRRRHRPLLRHQRGQLPRRADRARDRPRGGAPSGRARPSTRMIAGVRRGFALRAGTTRSFALILTVVTLVVDRRLQLPRARAAARRRHAARRARGFRPPVRRVRARRPPRSARDGHLPRGELALFAVGTASFGVLAAPARRRHNAVLAGTLLFGIGIAFTLFTANANALVQLAAPDHLRGRVVSLYLLRSSGSRRSAASSPAGSPRSAGRRSHSPSPVSSHLRRSASRHVSRSRRLDAAAAQQFA